MTAPDYLIAAWKERRALLQRQLEMLESRALHTGRSHAATAEQDIARTQSWIAELDALIAEHSGTRIA
jgi:hypothetical protein